MSARAYAKSIGAHPETVQSWCRNSMLPVEKRNPKLPPIVCRRIGSAWQIAVEKTELSMSLMCGNPTEREMAKKGMIL